jgi:hypothetical protein
MRRLGLFAITLGFACGTTATGFGAEPASAPPADFKLKIAVFTARAEPFHQLEIVVHKGRAYVFPAGPRLEVTLYDPDTARLEIFDLDRRVRTEVMLAKLEKFRTELHAAIAAASDRRAAKGGKANRVAADMSRDLIDPKFTAAFDAETRTLRLTNPTVEVDAKGDNEADPARLALIAGTLKALETLDAMNSPQGMPPFAQLEVLRVLIQEHHLRPAEISILYRLAGPPTKRRWAYVLVPELTAREIEALARVNGMRDRCKFLKYVDYQPAAAK